MQQQKALGELNGHVAEMFSGHTIITAFGHEARSIATFDALNDKYYEAAWRAQFASGLMLPIMMFVGNLGYVLVAVIGGILVTRRSIAIGDVQAFIQYARQFSQPIAQLSSIANTIQLTIVSAERVFELLDEEEETPDAPGAKTLSHPRGEVQFDQVSFSYKADAPLIENMTISVVRGQMVAIVGPTGAGKTTLVNLLMRFYDVDGGSIRVDGCDIRDLSRGGLRRLFGMVLQDTWLFSGTIRQNIAYGREGADEACDRPGGAGGAGGPLHPDAARELRHDHQRRGDQPVAGTETAVDDCTGVPGRPRRSDSRRGDQQRGHPHRGADSEGDGQPDEGPDDFRHRPSVIDD